MGQYSAENGLVNDWHLVHYGSRATGGVGLIIAEMTAVSETGRITLGCAGIYTDEQIVKWKTVTDFIHKTPKQKSNSAWSFGSKRFKQKTLGNGTNSKSMGIDFSFTYRF